MLSTPETLPLVSTPHIADHCREPLVAGVDALNPLILHARSRWLLVG